jgi:hypothetical protein
VGKRKLREPLKNDWLFSCPAKTFTPQIVAALQISEQPVIELSARNWTEDWRMANDLLRTYGYSESYFYKPGQHVNRDSLDDWIYGVRDLKGKLFIIRDCQTEVAENLVYLVDVVKELLRSIQKRPHLYPDKRLAVVLAGWTEPILEARISGHRVAFVVNPLPQDVMLLE